MDVEVDVEEDETNNARMDQSPPVLMVLPPSLMATGPLLPALTEASRGPALMGAHRSGSVEAEEEEGAEGGARSAVTAPLRHMTETGALRPAVTAADQCVARTSARRVTSSLSRPSNIVTRELSLFINLENLKDLLKRTVSVGGVRCEREDREGNPPSPPLCPA